MIGRVPRTAGWLLALLLLAGSSGAQAIPANAQRFTTVDGLPSNIVHAALEDRHGYLWFASDDGLARFDGRRFRIWRREQGLPDNQVLALARDADDQLWLGTAQGQLVRVSADRQELQRFDGRQFPALAGAAIVVVQPGPEGEVWFGTRGQGLFRLGTDGRMRQFLPTQRGDGVPDRTVEHLVITADGSLWVGTPRGLARWREGRFHAPVPGLLATAPVSALLVDGSGALWVAGAAGPWRATGTTDLQPLDLGTHTRALGVSVQGSTWLADGALVWRHGARTPPISLAALTGRLTPRFRAAYEDRHGGLWLLGRHLGVWRLPPHWQHFRPEPGADDPDAALGSVDLAGAQAHRLQCADGTRWQLDSQAIERREASGRTLQRWAWDPAVHPRPAGPVAVHCDGAEGLWWGGRSGLQRWSQGRFQALSVVAGEVNALHVAPDGTLWVGSPGVLRRFRVDAGGLQHSVRIDHRHGLPGVRFHSLATDAQGILWVSAARGLIRVQPREGQTRLYTRVDGVPASVFSARLRAQGSAMLAIAAGGRVRFDPAGLSHCQHRPAPVVERVQVHRDGQLRVLPSLSTVHLRPGDRDIQITVRRLGPAVDTPQYRFRVQGLDRDWIRVGRRGTRGFPRLPPGTHLLEFQARQADGHWSASQTLLLRVERSGWQHPLMVGLRLGLAVLLVGGAVWAALRRRARLRERRQSVARRDAALQSAQAKETYLSTLGHEVRTPLTGVLGLSELLLASPLNPAQRLQLERVRQGGQTLLHVLNQALDEARIEAGRMPLMAQGMPLASVVRQWHRRSVIALCRRGTGLVVCLHIPGDACTHGDAVRLMQLLDSVTETLAARTACAGLVVQVAWQPGRQRVRLDLTTTGARRDVEGRGGRAEGMVIPTPAPETLRTALAPARTLVRALDGTLQVHPLGGSGRWQVVISLALPERPPAAPPARRRVLLVDADAGSAEAVRRLLKSHGHDVLQARHALAALAEVQAQPVDAVLLALELPGVGGLALLEMLRAQRPRLPALVLMESRHDTPAMRAAIHAACATPLALPGTDAALRDALRQAWAG